jgi:glycosyltransferase involved in cell wall biosynthesis
MSNSKFVLEKHVQYGIDRDKIYVMTNYIEPAVNKADILNNYRGAYLYFGRISYEKGVFTAINAFKNMPEYKLLIMGNGECEEKIVTEISEYINIEYIGGKSGMEMLSVLKQSKCVIVPSEWEEPLPRTILEAYSCGIPVIGSDKGGIPEMVKNGLGYIFKAGNYKDLADSVRKFELLSETEYLNYRKNCLLECELSYSKKSYYNRFADCLCRIGVSVNQYIVL